MVVAHVPLTTRIQERFREARFRAAMGGMLVVLSMIACSDGAASQLIPAVRDAVENDLYELLLRESLSWSLDEDMPLKAVASADQYRKLIEEHGLHAYAVRRAIGVDIYVEDGALSKTYAYRRDVGWSSWYW